MVRAAGAEGTEITLSYDSGSVQQRDAAIIIQNAYQDLGFVVKLNSVPAASYFTELRAGNYDVWFQTVAPNTPHPAYALSLWYPCGGDFNTSKYCNPRVDELIDEAFITLDAASSIEVSREAQTLIIEDSPIVWMGELGWQIVTQQDIEGVSWENYQHV